jgi:hypothetical protein
VIVEVMLDSEGDEKTDVAIGYPVKHLSALLARPHQSGETKLSKLMARGRLGGSDELGDIGDTHLSPLDEYVDDADPTRVGEKLEALGEDRSLLFSDEGLRRWPMTMARCVA